jgi:hypothetical protein
MSQEIDVDKILDDAKLNAETLNGLKRRGKTHREVTIDGLLQYCDTVKTLCERVGELEGALQETIDNSRRRQEFNGSGEGSPID